MSGIDVRTATPADYDRIVAVLDDWWGRPIATVLPRLFLDHFADTSSIAEDEQGLAGFLVGFDSPTQRHVAYVHFVGVRPDLRRSGLAADLYGRFVERTRAVGRSEVHAITSPVNEGSIRFHQRIGFTVGGPVEDYNGRGRSVITFVLRLPA